VFGLLRSQMSGEEGDAGPGPAPSAFQKKKKKPQSKAVKRVLKTKDKHALTAEISELKRRVIEEAPRVGV
jgi:hypothetical protein